MPLIFNGSIQTLGQPSEAPQQASKPTQTLEQIRDQATQRMIKHQQRLSDKQSENDSGIIKPKYLNDKSVFYKTSGYLKDLLGEGN